MHSIPAVLPNDELPEIAIGVLSYNRADDVITTLEILRQIDYPANKFHLVLIDNASRDGTSEQVREAFGADVEILRLPVNIGAVARNRVILGRPEPYVFIFDEDCTPERPDTIRRVVEFMEAAPYFGALCFRSFNTHANIVEYGEFGGFSTRRLANGGYEGMYVIGNGMCFRREAINRTRGYDERLFWGGEEYDLALELMYHDVPIAFHPEFTLLHRHAPRAITPKRVHEVDIRNTIWVCAKYFPWPLATISVAIHIARRMVMALLKRDRNRLAGILAGIREGVADLPAFFATRKPVPVSKLARHNRWFFQMFYSPRSFSKAFAASQRNASSS